MRVRAIAEQGVRRLRFEGHGDLDLHCAADVKTQALALIDGVENIVFDLENVKFVDSAGLGVLVSLYKHTRTHGRSANFIRVQPAVMQVLEIIKLDRIFELYPDLESAAKALRAAS